MLLTGCILYAILLAVHCQQLHKGTYEVKQAIDRVTSHVAGLRGHNAASARQHPVTKLFEDPSAAHHAIINERNVADFVHSSLSNSNNNNNHNNPYQTMIHRCYKQPLSTRLNLTEIGYDYPITDIYQELEKKPSVLVKVYASRDTNQRFRKRQPPASFSAGCSQKTSTLEAFTWRGRYCWVLFPKHQDVQFVRCRYARCNSGSSSSSYSKCVARDALRPVWAFCLALPYGQRIVKFDLPLPQSCHCESGHCS